MQTSKIATQVRKRLSSREMRENKREYTRQVMRKRDAAKHAQSRCAHARRQLWYTNEPSDLADSLLAKHARTHARTTALKKRLKNVRAVTAPVGAAFPEGSLELWSGRPHNAQCTGRCERARGALTCFKGAQAHCELDADSHPFGNGRTYTPVHITSDEIILPDARTQLGRN